MLYHQVHTVGQVPAYLYTEKVAEKILVLHRYFMYCILIKSQSMLTAFNTLY